MDDSVAPLTLIERVRTSLSLGESHFREFKSALEGPPGNKVPRQAKLIKRDIGEALVAFSNADGGELLIGVEDDGVVTGVPHTPNSVTGLLEAWVDYVHPDTPLSPPRVARVEIDGVLVLYFSVEKSTSSVHLTSDGRCVQRRDRESVPVASEQIRFERQEKLSRAYDRDFVDGGDASSLDQGALDRVGDILVPGMSPEKVLQLLDLAEYSGSSVRLRRAAVLLLAQDVSKWHPRCEVRILRVSGTELGTGKDYNVISDKHVTGPILELLTGAWDQIRPFLVDTRFAPDGRFTEQVLYPEDACREALTNAIAHRDYSIEGRAIEVYVFDDRLEIRSPGTLLSNVTIDGIRRLEGVHQSRNTIIARTLRELGYMREMGEGFRRIFQLMREHDLVDPTIAADDQSFVVTLQHRSIFSEADQRWIAAYDNFDLARDEERALLLGRTGQPLSVQQILTALDIVDTEDYRLLIERLQEKGLIRGLKRSKANRNAPRWLVIQPKDADRHFSDLLRETVATYEGVRLTRRQLGQIANALDVESPFRSDQVGKNLRRLGLVDSAGTPAGRLKAVLASSAPLKPADRAGTSPETRRKEVLSREEPPRFSTKEIVALPEETVSQKLYLGGLPLNITKEGVRELLEGVHEVERVWLPRDRSMKHHNRGFAFVLFGTIEGAAAAKRALTGRSFEGHQITVDWARS